MKLYLLFIFLFLINSSSFAQSHPKLYFTLPAEGVLRCNPDGSDLETVIETNIHSPNSVAFDEDANLIYFTDAGKNSVCRMNTDGTGFIVLYRKRGERILSLQLNPVSHKLYWVNLTDNTLVEADTDGNNQQVVYHMGNETFVHYHFDTENNDLYFFNQTAQKIQKVTLNNLTVVDIVVFPTDPNDFLNIYRTGSIKADLLNNKMYYAYYKRIFGEAHDYEFFIERTNLDGTGVEVITSSQHSIEAPYFIRDFALFPAENRLIYVRGFGGSGDFIEIDLGKNFQRQTDFHHYRCINFGSTYFAASSDGNRFVYSIVEPKGIGILNVNENGETNTQNLLDQKLSNPLGVAVDQVNSKLYFTDDGSNQLLRANLDGSNIETLIERFKEGPIGIALDIDNDHLFWSDFDYIYRHSLGGEFQELVTGETSNSQQVNPTVLALDTDSQTLYSSWQSSSGIYQSGYSSGRQLVARSLTPFSLALDRTNQILFSTTFDYVTAYSFPQQQQDSIICLRNGNSVIIPSTVLADPTNQKIFLILDNKLVKSSYDGKNIDVLIDNLPTTSGAYYSMATEGSHANVIGDFPAENCYDYTASETQSIESGTNEYSITIPVEAIIKDLNVIDLNGSFVNFGTLTFSLVTPSGQQIDLMEQGCITESDFDFSFNETSFYALSDMDCSTDGEGKYYQPKDDLSITTGQTALGEWKLLIQNPTMNTGNLNSWGIQICTENAVPLAIENFAFALKQKQSNAVQLSWTTKNIRNVASFAIQYKTTFTDWNTIAMLPAKHNLSAVNNYQYIHQIFDGQQHFYRIKYQSDNGEVNYSPTKTIRLINENTPFIYPNPTKSIVHLLTDNAVIYDVFDSAGNLLKQGQINKTIDLIEYPKGLYFLKIQTGRGTFVEKIIRE